MQSYRKTHRFIQYLIDARGSIGQKTIKINIMLKGAGVLDRRSQLFFRLDESICVLIKPNVGLRSDL